MCTCLMCALYLSRLVNFESQKSQGIHKFRCFCSICRATIARKGRLNWQTEQDHNFPPSSSYDSVKYSATMSSTNKKKSLKLWKSLLDNGSMIVRFKLIASRKFSITMITWYGQIHMLLFYMPCYIGTIFSGIFTNRT